MRLCSNAHRVGSKQEETGVCGEFLRCSLMGIRETWSDGSHRWSVARDRSSLFRKDGAGQRGGGVALCVNKQQESMELRLATGDEPDESRWVGIHGQTNLGDVLVSVCYGPALLGGRSR